MNFSTAVAHYKAQVERVNAAFARANEGIAREIAESGGTCVTTSSRSKPDSPKLYMSYETSEGSWVGSVTSEGSWVGSVTDQCQCPDRGDRCWALEQLWRLECVELKHAEATLVKLLEKYSPSYTAAYRADVVAVVVAVVAAHEASLK